MGAELGSNWDPAFHASRSHQLNPKSALRPLPLLQEMTKPENKQNPKPENPRL